MEKNIVIDTQLTIYNNNTYINSVINFYNVIIEKNISPLQKYVARVHTITLHARMK